MLSHLPTTWYPRHLRVSLIKVPVWMAIAARLHSTTPSYSSLNQIQVQEFNGLVNQPSQFNQRQKSVQVVLHMSRISAVSLTILICLFLATERFEKKSNRSYTSVTSDLPQSLQPVLERLIESKKKKDYTVVIRSCQEAMVIFDETGLPVENVHYSGVILQLAEIFEIKGDMDKAASVYRELVEHYISKLSEYGDKPSYIDYDIQRWLASKFSFFNSATSAYSKYDFMISQMLMLSTRYWYLVNKGDKPHAERLLRYSLIKALTRLMSLNPTMFEVSARTCVDSILDLIYNLEPYPTIAESPVLVGRKTYIDRETRFLSKSKLSLPVFTQTLSIAIELYARILESKGEREECIEAAISSWRLLHIQEIKYFTMIANAKLAYHCLKFTRDSKKGILTNKVWDKSFVRLLTTYDVSFYYFEEAIRCAKMRHPPLSLKVLRKCVSECTLVSYVGLGILESEFGRKESAINYFKDAKSKLRNRGPSDDNMNYMDNLNANIIELQKNLHEEK